MFYEEGEFPSGLRMAVTKGMSSTGDWDKLVCRVLLVDFTPKVKDREGISAQDNYANSKDDQRHAKLPNQFWEIMTGSCHRREVVLRDSFSIQPLGAFIQRASPVRFLAIPPVFWWIPLHIPARAAFWFGYPHNLPWFFRWLHFQHAICLPFNRSTNPSNTDTRLK